MQKSFVKTGWSKFAPCFDTGIMGACFAAFVFTCLSVSSALADGGIPQDWGKGMQEPGSSIASRISDFHNFLLVIITGVSILVLVLLLYVMVRYNKRANPNPSTTTHNVKLEIIWTLIPCLIVLISLGFRFHCFTIMDRMPPPDLTLKVTGHQWYWSYEYPDQGDVSFNSIAIWSASDVTDAQVQPPSTMRRRIG